MEEKLGINFYYLTELTKPKNLEILWFSGYP